MSLRSNTSNKINEHTHNLPDGQLICDNEQCREKVLDKINEINNEIKTDFNTIVQDNQLNNTQAWNKICLISKNLSDRLVILFNKEEIHQIIEQFIKQNNTKQAFEKRFDYEKKKNINEYITKQQLWNIYMKMCEDAVKLLSKSKKERRKHIANFLVVDQ